MHPPLKPLHIDLHEIPIVKIDTDLATLSPERLSAEFLRTHFKHPPAHWAYATQDHHTQDRFMSGVSAPLLNGRPMQPAAVLIPIFQNASLSAEQGNDGKPQEAASDFSVLFMQRSIHLKDHPGQISFPGGKVEPDDAHIVATALREAEEEVGLAPDQVEVLGQLPQYKTHTAFNITPVVGLIKEPQRLTLSAGEVASAFTVPFAFLMNPANHRWHERAVEQPDGRVQTWRWLSIEYTHHGKTYFIWGATAAILRNLYSYLLAEK